MRLVDTYMADFLRAKPPVFPTQMLLVNLFDNGIEAPILQRLCNAFTNECVGFGLILFNPQQSQSAVEDTELIAADFELPLPADVLPEWLRP